MVISFPLGPHESYLCMCDMVRLDLPDAVFLFTISAFLRSE